MSKTRAYKRRETGDPLGHLAAAIVEVAIAHAKGKLTIAYNEKERRQLKESAIRYLRGEGGALALHCEAAGLTYSQPMQEAIADLLRDTG